MAFHVKHSIMLTAFHEALTKRRSDNVPLLTKVARVGHRQREWPQREPPKVTYKNR